MEGFGFYDKAYEWHRNGRLKRFDEKDDNRRHIRIIRFDENGNITLWIENGITKIDKG
jgi:antitoxin component YwqK of YwqJK toxin-antitoxin module